MKKLTMMLFASIMVSLLSCSKDNDNKDGSGNGGGNQPASIVGDKWEVSQYADELGEDQQPKWQPIIHPCEQHESMAFTKDNKFRELKYVDCTEDNLGGKWELSNEKILTLTYEDTSVETFKIIDLNKDQLSVENTSTGKNKEHKYLGYKRVKGNIDPPTTDPNLEIGGEWIVSKVGAKEDELEELECTNVDQVANMNLVLQGLTYAKLDLMRVDGGCEKTGDGGTWKYSKEDQKLELNSASSSTTKLNIISINDKELIVKYDNVDDAPDGNYIFVKYTKK